MLKIHLLSFLVILFLGLLFRYIFAWFTISPLDADSFYRIYTEMKNGQGIYSPNWFYFNNPPVWGWLIWLCGNVAEKTNLSLSFLLKIPLIISDLLISLLIFKYALTKKNFRTGICYFALVFLNPLLITVSSYQGQMESLFLYFLLLSALVLHKLPITNRTIILAGMLFGLSCTVKVIPLMVLPVFLIYLVKNQSSLSKKISSAVIFTTSSLLPMVIVFLPFLSNLSEIFLRIFAYRPPFWGFWGIVSIYSLIDLFLPMPVFFKNLLSTNQLIVLFLGIFFYLFIILRQKNNLIKSILIAFLSIYITSTFFSPHYLVWIVPFLSIMLIDFKKSKTVSFLVYSLLSFLIEISWLLSILADEKNTWKRWSIISMYEEIIVPDFLIQLGNLVTLPYFLLLNLAVWLICWYLLFLLLKKVNLQVK